ncbi:MAG: winged helix-turn-helix transcriptional regulator [archaeon]
MGVKGLFPFLKSLFKKEKKEKKNEKEAFVEKEKEIERPLDLEMDSNSFENYKNRKKDSRDSEIINEREILWEMNKKLEELLEIKGLYEDMLDWMVEISKKEEKKGREESRQVPTESRKVSNLSPRLRQILEIVGEKGELESSELSEELGLSRNRCSELLNTLFKANYLNKKRVGRKVYYRLKIDKEDLFYS